MRDVKLSSLGTKSVAAVKWSALGSVTRYALQLGGQIILARLLGPENYGLFALGLITLTLTSFLADFGFGWGLVQAKSLTDEDIRFVFTCQAAIGVVVAAGLYLAAPVVAWGFNEPRLQAILEWLCVACFFTAIHAPGNSLLRRDLDFRAINLIQVTSYFLGYFAVGIPLALHGAGVWSLVAAWLTQSFCAMALTLLHRPYPKKPLLRHSGPGELRRVGVTVFVTNSCNWMLNNIDRLVIGRILSTSSVGLYSVGYNLATTPNSFLLDALQPAFFSAAARLQSEPERLRKVYISVISTVWILVAPLFVVLGIVAPDLVMLVYGREWAVSGQVLQILALAMPAFVTWGVSTPVLWNTGHKHWENLLQWPLLLLAVGLYLQFAASGVMAVAGIAAAVIYLRAIAITTAACHCIGVGLRDVLPSACRAVFIIGIVGLGAYGGLLWGGMRPGGAGALLGGLAVGGICLLLAACTHSFILGSATTAMLERFFPRYQPFFDAVPRWIGWKAK